MSLYLLVSYLYLQSRGTRTVPSDPIRLLLIIAGRLISIAEVPGLDTFANDDKVY